MEIMDHITFKDLADPKRRAAVELSTFHPRGIQLQGENKIEH
jgi:hypothetical protein